MSTVRHGVARVLSKIGYCSRTQAIALVEAGRVSVNGKRVHDPGQPFVLGRDQVSIDGEPLKDSTRIYIALNKPRGLVTSTRDERGRDTVYSCFEGATLPWIAPVGRLDRASEGLLLFTNDSTWSTHLTDPASHVDKTYHVQIDRRPNDELLQRMTRSENSRRDPESLAAKSVTLLREGEKNAWLSIVLDEGKNRQIRRLLERFEIQVLRLMRVAIGNLELGDLPKGEWRELTTDEIAGLRSKRIH